MNTSKGLVGGGTWPPESVLPGMDGHTKCENDENLSPPELTLEKKTQSTRGKFSLQEPKEKAPACGARQKKEVTKGLKAI